MLYVVVSLQLFPKGVSHNLHNSPTVFVLKIWFGSGSRKEGRGLEREGPILWVFG